MANYAVTDYKTSESQLGTVIAALETKLETIDTSKTIRYIDVLPMGNGEFVGVIIYDA